MFPDNHDLPTELKQKLIQELIYFKYSLCDLNPIGSSAFGCAYKTKNTITGNLGVCKVILISEDLSTEAKDKLIKSVEEEVKKIQKNID